MLNLIKIILFLIVIAGIGIYFLTRTPEISQNFFSLPDIFSKKNIFSRQTLLSKSTPKINAPSTPSPIPLPSPIISKPKTVIEPMIPDNLIPLGFKREQLSPFFKKIKISSAYTSSWNIVSSQIRLYSYLSEGETINMTNWKIKSNKQEITIPQAINIYEPSGISTQEDIIVSKNNSSINIYSNSSPLNKNLRLNKCIGYLQNNYNFNPPLPNDCPSVPRSEINHLSGQCQSYILSLWECKLPDVSFYNSLPGNDQGNACRAFLNTINHNTCYNKHRFDADFLSNEWRFWVNQNILDSQHDRLWLFDKNGLLADEYIY